MPYSRREQGVSRHMEASGRRRKSEADSLYDLRFGYDILHIVDSLHSRPAHLFPDDIVAQLRSRIFVADWVFAEGHSSKDRGQYYNDRRACTLTGKCTNGGSLWLGGLEAAEEIIRHSSYDPWDTNENLLADCRGDDSCGRWGTRYLDVMRWSGRIVSVGTFA